MGSFDLSAVQKALVEFQLDGWLLYDFRGLNVLGQRVMEVDPELGVSRRYSYFIPVNGEPRKLVHRIEQGTLDHLPGNDKTVYLAWQEFENGLKYLVGDAKKVAMEYSPRNANPYVSRVDAGTVELVRSFGPEIVSSGDLVQYFEARWDSQQWNLHLEADTFTQQGFEIAWDFMAEEIRKNGAVREYTVQQKVMDHFTSNGLETYHPPIIAIGKNAANPHYGPEQGNDAELKEGDLVLVDMWAKMSKPRAVYSDLTKMGFLGTEVPQVYQDRFTIIAQARDAAIELVKERMSKDELLYGWEVDQVCRDVIVKAGYGDYFVHRTGHNIGQETHGNGAHIDNLETQEDRRIMRNTCFSIEPGIYKEFGVRTEIDLFVDGEGKIHVTGGELQYDIVPILAR
ncbi:MAG: M24 family metallopeptidase [Pirellulaceae bacterium]|nr:M24 family metallopeptidase [Pirellulaceae bacterium]